MTNKIFTKSDPCAGMLHHWAVVLAGGEGRRLLPLTRRLSGDERPKQFCRVLGNETLLDQTLHQVVRIVSPYRTFSVVTKAHEQFYGERRAGVRGARLLVQPINRGTGPAIVYSLARLQQIDPRAVVGVFPSDLYFAEDKTFSDCVRRAYEATHLYPNSVILVGVTPDQPETGYAWIEPGEPLTASPSGVLFSVRRFWEKPSSPIAIELMRRGCFWNSFIMVGRLASFLSLLGRTVPDLLQSFQAIAPMFFTRNEEARVLDLYQSISSGSFSTDVLAVSPADLAVFCGGTLEWADVGDVGRVASIIAGSRAATRRREPAVAPEIARIANAVS